MLIVQIADHYFLKCQLKLVQLREYKIRIQLKSCNGTSIVTVVKS